MVTRTYYETPCMNNIPTFNKLTTIEQCNVCAGPLALI